MKITASIDESVMNQAMYYSKAKTATEALKTALNMYISVQKLKELNQQIESNPLHFTVSAAELRETNR
jgi:hypothetical protein